MIKLYNKTAQMHQNFHVTDKHNRAIHKILCARGNSAKKMEKAGDRCLLRIEMNTINYTHIDAAKRWSRQYFKKAVETIEEFAARLNSNKAIYESCIVKVSASLMLKTIYEKAHAYIFWNSTHFLVVWAENTANSKWYSELDPIPKEYIRSAAKRKEFIYEMVSGCGMHKAQVTTYDLTEIDTFAGKLYEDRQFNGYRQLFRNYPIERADYVTEGPQYLILNDPLFKLLEQKPDEVLRFDLGGFSGPDKGPNVSFSGKFTEEMKATLVDRDEDLEELQRTEETREHRSVPIPQDRLPRARIPTPEKTPEDQKKENLNFVKNWHRNNGFWLGYKHEQYRRSFWEGTINIEVPELCFKVFESAAYNGAGKSNSFYAFISKLNFRRKEVMEWLQFDEVMMKEVGRDRDRPAEGTPEWQVVQDGFSLPRLRKELKERAE